MFWWQPKIKRSLIFFLENAGVININLTRNNVTFISQLVDGKVLVVCFILACRLVYTMKASSLSLFHGKAMWSGKSPLGAFGECLP